MRIYPWQQAPLIRLLVPLIVGILLQWYIQLPVVLSVIAGILSLVLLLCFFFFSLPGFASRTGLFLWYRISWISGVAVTFLFISIGAILTHAKDIHNHHKWFGHSYKDSIALLVTLDETVSEKTNSYKATALVSYIFQQDSLIPVKGKIILYLQKGSLSAGLIYGNRLIIKKPLLEINNTGNPGAFDYKRYSLFHGITHQVYLKTGEYSILHTSLESPWKKFIYTLRDKAVTVLQNNIKGKREAGLAEALLIGYKDDLDKDLVQSYSNTGVIHIIAISGLHLGLIYWILLRLFRPFQRRKCKWLRPVFIISGLWIFTCMAGAQPSVVRSALMFTCIVAGESFTRKTNIYNTLALSAFLLLCYDPYWLWDIGFQLSYAAVVSLALFMKPIHGLFYSNNKLLQLIWQLNAVTLSAQLLTLPLSIYYFHQFPNYFLLTNLVAVPLSSIILIGEIILCVFSFIPIIASFIGQLLSWLIQLMNSCIEIMELLPFALWDHLLVNPVQTILLYCFILAFSYRIMHKSVLSLKTALIALLLVIIIRSFSFIETSQQQKIIVYNIPGKQAIDIIDGDRYIFIGDTSAEKNRFIQNFHLRPSRILHRTTLPLSLNNYSITKDHISINNRHILLLDRSISLSLPDSLNPKPIIDLLILSKNPKIYIKKLHQSLAIRQVVIDGSVPAWKSGYWKKDCDSLDIPCHDVRAKGAFAMNLR